MNARLLLGIVAGMGLISMGSIFGAGMGHGLPASNGFFSISLTPGSDTGEPGTDHTVTAAVTDAVLDTPEAGVQVTFEIVSGPNAGAHLTCAPDPDCFTDGDGRVSASYTGGGEGLDAIRACTPIVPEPEPACATVTKNWVEASAESTPSSVAGPDSGLTPTPTPTPAPTASLPASGDPATLPSTGSDPATGSALPFSVAAALTVGVALVAVAAAIGRTLR
jgi:hypothetical protein